MVENYKYTFEHTLKRKGEVNHDLANKILTFKNFLTTSKTNLDSWKEKSKILSDIYSKFLDALDKVNKPLKKNI